MKNPVLRITKTTAANSKKHSGLSDWLIWVIIILLAPLVLLFNLLSWPFQKFGRARLKKAIQKLWLPNQKYIYLDYDSDSGLEKFIVKTILSKYGQHIVLIDWDRPQKNVSYISAARLISSTVIRDYDGEYEATIVTIKPNSEPVLAYTGLKGTYANAPAAAEKKIEKIIAQTIAAWENRQSKPK